jgi:arylsulfatase A-like enzyme
MSRRSALQTLGAGSLGVLATLGTRSADAGETRLQVDARPNIVLIVADDMRADDLVDMPATQELLVAQGMSFEQCFASTPSCAPSRASILRGQYPHNHGVLRGSEKHWGFGLFRELGNETSTVATWLHDVGYRTALVGKYLNNYPSGAAPNYIPAGWDEWIGVTNGGYEDFELNEGGTLVSYNQRDQPYQTDVLATKATDFVTRTGKSDQPFFLYIAPRAPHAPITPAARHEGAFADASAPRPPSFDAMGVGKPSWVQEEPALDGRALTKVDSTYRARKETLLGLDELIADLVDSLAATGRLDNTYIILTSDNGYHLGEHRVVAAKGTAYEEVIRVPLVVRGPDVPVGQTMALASVIDLAPTIATWADAEIPGFVDGRSLIPALDGDQPAWRRAVLVQQYRDHPHKVVGPPAYQALRADGFVYVEYDDGLRELYDLRVDPYQLDNLAATADPTLIEAFSIRLSALKVCASDSCREVEDSLLPDAMFPGFAAS